jgi:hypothetical protein
MKLSQAVETKPSNTEKTTRDVIITGVAGLFTGCVIGAPLSVTSFLLWKKAGVNGAARWWVWAATGLVGVPLSWILLIGLVSPSSTRQASSLNPASSTGSTSAESSKTDSDVKVGEFQTEDFQYTNVRIVPYQIQNSFTAQQANVAGKLYEVTADVKNIGKESEAPHLSSIEVTDSQGRTFKEADFVVRNDGLAKGQNSTDYILPGQAKQNIRLSMVDASPDATGFTLKAGEMFGRSQTVQPIQ